MHVWEKTIDVLQIPFAAQVSIFLLFAAVKMFAIGISSSESFAPNERRALQYIKEHVGVSLGTPL